MVLYLFTKRLCFVSVVLYYHSSINLKESGKVQGLVVKLLTRDQGQVQTSLVPASESSSIFIKFLYHGELLEEIKEVTHK